MFKLIILCSLAVLGVALGAEEVPILVQEMALDPDGHIHWSYESGDGSKAVQDGELKVIDKDNAAQVLRGSYEYKGDDGQSYAITYTADENGYHPEGDHLPKAPLVPDLIRQSLRYLATASPPTE